MRIIVDSGNPEINVSNVSVEVHSTPSITSLLTLEEFNHVHALEIRRRIQATQRHKKEQCIGAIFEAAFMALILSTVIVSVVCLFTMAAP